MSLPSRASFDASLCACLSLVDLSAGRRFPLRRCSPLEFAALSRRRPAPPPNRPLWWTPTGPDISLQNSEALFDIAAALNSCGYDQGLAASDPVRQQVREQVNQALQASADARDAHDRFALSSISIGFPIPGPTWRSIFPSPSTSRRPRTWRPAPKARTCLPTPAGWKTFCLCCAASASSSICTLIWLHVRPQYDKQLGQLHDSLTKMIDDTGIYLKTPAGSSSGRRFLVVVEPLLDPAQTNARVYGADYVVVASPVNGTIHMREVRHAYLHYQIEPLLYARATALDRLLPFLKTVRDCAPRLHLSQRHRGPGRRVHDPGRSRPGPWIPVSPFTRFPPISAAAILKPPPTSTMPRSRQPKRSAAMPSRSPWRKAMC